MSALILRIFDSLSHFVYYLFQFWEIPFNDFKVASNPSYNDIISMIIIYLPPFFLLNVNQDTDLLRLFFVFQILKNNDLTIIEIKFKCKELFYGTIQSGWWKSWLAAISFYVQENLQQVNNPVTESDDVNKTYLNRILFLKNHECPNTQQYTIKSAS
jgi:hypothetical protein